MNKNKISIQNSCNIYNEIKEKLAFEELSQKMGYSKSKENQYKNFKLKKINNQYYINYKIFYQKIYFDKSIKRFNNKDLLFSGKIDQLKCFFNKKNDLIELQNKFNLYLNYLNNILCNNLDLNIKNKYIYVNRIIFELKNNNIQNLIIDNIYFYKSSDDYKIDINFNNNSFITLKIDQSNDQVALKREEMCLTDISDQFVKQLNKQILELDKLFTKILGYKVDL